MSETTTEKAEVSPYPKIVEGTDGVIYELQTFDKESKFAGFYFYTKSFKNLEMFNNHFRSIKPNDDPETLIVSLLNGSIAAKMRTKVTAGELPSEAGALEKLLRDGRNLVISLEEAQKFLPGERSPWSETGINKKLNDLIDDRKKIKAELENPETSEERKEILKLDDERIKAEGKMLLKKLEELRNEKDQMFD